MLVSRFSVAVFALAIEMLVEFKMTTAINLIIVLIGLFILLLLGF